MSFGIPDALAIIGLLAFEGWNRHCLAKTHKLEVEQIEALMKDVEQRTITHVDTIVGDLRNKVGAMSMVRSVR